MQAIQSPSFVYVEDDEFSREIMRTLLQERMGYERCAIFSTGVDLIDRLKALSDTPNVFFLDIQMRPLNGYDLLQIIRKEPAYQNATIVAMTANVMSYDVEQLRQAGFDGLIGKPIRQKVFAELIERLLAGESVWYVP
ncbi:MAG: response regulator [Anaerolinea sp.]|nr:response regulator [Anaerolinea sp.]MCC6974185.1 response regulator [Anaerolineae bacterium]